MREKQKRIILIASVFIGFSLMTGGCWDERELNNLAIVLGTGIDYNHKTKKTHLIFEVIKPTQMKSSGSGGGRGGSGGGGGKGEAAFEIIDSQGDTLFAAINNATFQSSRRLYFAHNMIIVMGKSVAEKGIQPFLDFIIRDPYFRPILWVVMAEGKTDEVFSTRTKLHLEKSPAMELNGLLLLANATSEVAAINLQEITEQSLSKTAAITIPIVRQVKRGEESFLDMNGSAVLKEGKLVGELDKRQTRGLLWVTNRVRDSVLTRGEKESLAVVGASGKIQPKLRAGQITVAVEIKFQANLAEEQITQSNTNPAALNKLEKHMEGLVKREVIQTLRQARRLKADIFGFGESIGRKYPKKWHQLEPRWDTEFSKIKVTVKVNAVLRLVGKTTRNLYTR
jgi:spore germination protein KC